MKLKIISLSLVTILGGIATGMLLKQSNDSSASQKLSVLSGPLTKLASSVIPSVLADGPPTAMETLRNNIFLIIGYPSTATYTELTGGEGPPENGLLGIMNGMIDAVSTIASADGVENCAGIPTEGELTGSVTILENTVNMTVTFAEGSKTVPAGWENAGETYAKKISIDGGVFQVEIHFSCDRAAAFAAMSLPGDTIDESTRTLNVFYDTEDADATKVEMAMIVTHPTQCGGAQAPSTCDMQLLKAETAASNGFKLWSAGVNWRGEKYQAERMLIEGNYETQAMTSFYTFESEFTNFDDVTGGDAGVLGGETFDFSATTTADLAIKGCVDFNTPNENPANSDDCEGAALEGPGPSVYGDLAFTYTGLKTLEAEIDLPNAE